MIDDSIIIVVYSVVVNHTIVVVVYRIGSWGLGVVCWLDRRRIRLNVSYRKLSDLCWLLCHSRRRDGRRGVLEVGHSWLQTWIVWLTSHPHRRRVSSNVVGLSVSRGP